MSQRPLAVAMLLCEQIIVDDKTKRITPVNCFSRWIVEGSLAEPQSFHVLSVLTSGHGSMRGALTIDRLDNGQAVFVREFTASFGDPLQRYTCMLKMRRVRFPVGGVYAASLFMDGESVASTRFTVLYQE